MNMTLLDCSLPEKKMDNILAILKANNMPTQNVPEEKGFYNCWGFVAFYYGWEKKPRWVAGDEMECHLDDNTESIEEHEVTTEDIAVFRRCGELTHTALMTPDRSVVCHKPGSTALCIDTLKRARESYGDYCFVRPVKVAVTP